MDKAFLKQAARQIFFAVLSACVFSLLALSVAAVFIKWLLPPQTVVTAVNWCVKCAAAFLFPMLFVRGQRALFKGIAFGVLFVLCSFLLFAAIGGGAHIDGFFALELAVSGILGGAGALLGAKLRKA